MSPTHERQPENLTEKYFHHIRGLIHGQVLSNPQYKELIGRKTPHPEAFRRTIEAVVDNKDNELSLADRSLLTVTSQLGTFVQAQYELQQNRSDEYQLPNNSDRERVRDLKQDYIIPFNHSLKEFINTHPNDDIRTVSSALANAYQYAFNRYDCLPSDVIYYGGKPRPADILGSIQDSLDGMRHEVAAETLLDVVDYTYDRKVTAQEDAAGADLFVYLESGWEAVDIKASSGAVEKAHQSRRLSRAVWTGLDWGDFTGMRGDTPGALSIPYEIAEEKADAFLNNIYAMVRHNQTQRSAMAARAGKRGLASR